MRKTKLEWVSANGIHDSRNPVSSYEGEGHPGNQEKEPHYLAECRATTKKRLPTGPAGRSKRSRVFPGVTSPIPAKGQYDNPKVATRSACDTAANASSRCQPRNTTPQGRQGCTKPGSSTTKHPIENPCRASPLVHAFQVQAGIFGLSRL